MRLKWGVLICQYICDKLILMHWLEASKPIRIDEKFLCACIMYLETSPDMTETCMHA